MFSVRNYQQQNFTPSRMDVDPLQSLAKTAVGQTIDHYSPTGGLIYHGLATATAKHPLDFALGLAGLFGSLHKLNTQHRRPLF